MDVAPWEKHLIRQNWMILDGNQLYLMVVVVFFDAIQWYSMVLDGIQCYSIVFIGIHRDSQEFLEVPWDALVFNGI